ncbi:MAG TPA: hypothetical protein VF493_12325 [Terriglobales bacterium]
MQRVIRRRISAVAFGFLMVLPFESAVLAQGEARLQVRVTVVPAVTARPLPSPQLSAPQAPDAQLIWGVRQQAHIVTRTAKPAEFNKDWLNPSNPCVSDGTKVLPRTSDAGPCEITINTVEFVTE